MLGMAFDTHTSKSLGETSQVRSKTRLSSAPPHPERSTQKERNREMQKQGQKEKVMRK